MGTATARPSNTRAIKNAAQKTTEPKEAEATTEKISFMNVIVEVLATDLKSVGRYIKNKQVKPHIVRRAAREAMRTHPKAQGVELFAQWVKNNYPTGRGKTPPQLGEVRPYKGQQVKTKAKKGVPATMGTVFNRTPLGPLGVAKGQTVMVEFNHATDDDPAHIKIYKKPGQD